ncbi:cell division cycle protein 27 homolog isoform X1 [Lepeophtheirus salmonis]|uniref:cell division cycle protein 27 homolog isoform X1 n=1 Tax=Lepeophtheirus salmonis TaxID=72036 RepID=UPI001AE5633E|nr:cell division cycle protein 27 homolog isoform X1 [Lepeophtheirus salmonis]
MLVQEPVQAAIWHCLNHYAYGDATFLAEKLLSEVDTDESAFLLATCYYRSGKLNQAYDVLQGKGLRSQQNRFLMARCCTDLNKLIEAETILNGDSLDPRKERTMEDIITDFGDSSCFAYKMIASIYAQTERLSKALDAERKSLKLNPLLWKSYESLCLKGDSPDPNKIFNVHNIEHFNHIHGTNSLINLINASPAPPQEPVSHVIANHLHQTPQSQPLPHSPAIPPITVTPFSGVDTPPYNLISTPNTNSRYISGINSLNYSTDIESPAISTQAKPALMPPPIRMRKRYSTRIAPSSTSTTLNNSTVSTPNNLNNSSSTFVPTFGTLNTNCQLYSRRILTNSLSSSSPLVRIQLNFSSSVIELSNTSLIMGSPANQSANTNLESALTNATNNELKISKRSIMGSAKENPLKPNLFSAQSSNISSSPASQIVRRSSRLFGSTQSVKENSKTPTSPSTGSLANPIIKNRVASKSPSRKTNLSRNVTPKSNNNIDNSVSEKNEKNKEITLKEDKIPQNNQSLAISSANLAAQAMAIQKSSLEGLLSLLKTLGTAFLEYSQFNCRKSLNILDDVSPHHRNKGWTLGLVAKNHYELGEYKEAKKYFQEVRDQEPYRLDYMEYYSTALWHLQEEIELSSLAQELTRIDKFAPQAWCSAGNCFSLQKEHENAIKFFQRAVQVQPDFAYAYTLLGHEYVMIEELDKALACFRSAIRVDPRHYNAWYGLGLAYYKQEAYQMTEIYYKKALSINKQSPILMCHVAVVQHALQKTERALETLNAAIKAAPKNPLCKFERASILFSSERYEEALEELNELKEIIPKESPVYFLMGKVYNKLNNKNLALMHFSWAMDLDPKGANSQIKDALDPTLNRVAQEESAIQHADDPMQVTDATDPSPRESINQDISLGTSGV